VTPPGIRRRRRLLTPEAFAATAQTLEHALEAATDAADAIRAVRAFTLAVTRDTGCKAGTQDPDPARRARALVRWGHLGRAAQALVSANAADEEG